MVLYNFYNFREINIHTYNHKKKKFSLKHTRYNNRLSSNKYLIKDAFNLIVFSDSKPSSGYKLKLNNIKKKNSTHLLNFINTKPPEGSITLAVITYPYCVLNVENLNKFKITIN